MKEWNKIIILFKDTTERDLVASLENNNNYKDNLLASVTHELRTPLNGTLNLIESALDHPSTPPKIRDELLFPAL